MGNLNNLVSLIAQNDKEQGLLPRPISTVLQYQRAQRLAVSLGKQLPWAKYFADAFMNTQSSNDLTRVLQIYQTLDYRTTVHGAENLPTNQCCLILANHPSGIPDVLIALHTLYTKSKTTPYAVWARKNLLLDPEFQNRLIPIDTRKWKGGKVNLEELGAKVRQAQQENAPIIVFPSWNYSHKNQDGKVEDGRRSWIRPKIAYQYDIPIIPFRIQAIPSKNFYEYAHIGFIGRLLSTLMAVEELAGEEINIHIGEPIQLTKRLNAIKNGKNITPQDWCNITEYLRCTTEELWQNDYS